MTDWYPANSDVRLGEAPEPKTYYCPICNRECETIKVIKNTGEPIGCDRCIADREPWDVLEAS